MSPEQLPGKIGKSVGEKLRAARIAQNYTQSQLAAPDFSVSYISAIERGQIHPSLRALEILARRLGLSSTQLLPNRSQQDDRRTPQIVAPERDDDDSDLVLLETQLLIIQGAAPQAIAQLNKISTKRLKRPQQLQHRYLLGWAYFRAEQMQESEYTLSEAAQIAKDTNDTYLSLRILNLLGMTYAAMRNHTQALLSHQRCLNQLEEIKPQDPFFTAQIYMHMGQHHTQLENLDQALDMFTMALSVISEFTTPQKIQSIYWDICQHHTLAKEFALAALYSYKCAHLYDQESVKRLRSELHHYLGHAMLKGDKEKARTYLDTVLQRDDIVQDQLTRASILTSNAEWYFEQHILTEAEKYAQQAHEMASLFGDTIIAAEALIILGRVQYAQAQYEEGDKHFVSGLEMLERLRNREELANQSVRYAQLLEERGREREAFAYFRRAFQSSQGGEGERR